MNIKEIVTNFSQCFGRAKAELAKSLLWQEIKRIFTPGVSRAARPQPAEPELKVPDFGTKRAFPDFQPIKTPPFSIYPGSETDEAIQVDTEPKPAVEPEVPAICLHTDSLYTQAEAIEDENLRDLLKDRLANITEGSDMEQQALLAAALLDEIGIFNAAYTGNDFNQLKQICRELRLELEANQCELLDSDTWVPEIQRAI